MTKLPLLLLGCTLVAGFGPNLAIRHGVEESRYVELGKSFPAVAHVGGLGSGTLVAPDWVLTAAHVPEMIQNMRRDTPLKVALAGKEYEVAQVVVPEERELERDRHDIALLQLTTPVPDELVPHPLWEADVEPGTEFVLAGWGVLAVGDEGLEITPEVMAIPTRALRAGWNTVERLDLEKALLMARFDAEGGLELEAGPSVGDSGGPALIRVEGHDDAPPTWHVFGVIALVDDVDEDRIVGEYGDEFGLTFVAAYAEWIRETIGR